MPRLQQFPLLTTSGRTGHVWRSARFLDRDETNHVRLEDGTEFDVPSASLTVQSDGTILLQDAAPAAQTVEPPTERLQMTPSTRTYPMPQEQPQHPAVPSQAQAHAQPQAGPQDTSRSLSYNEPLFMEDVDIERIPVNRIIDGPMHPRQEGDVTVVPVIEEVVTVQKRLLLREEVRITRRRTELRQPRQIVMTDHDNRVVGADGRDIEV